MVRARPFWNETWFETRIRVPTVDENLTLCPLRRSRLGFWNLNEAAPPPNSLRTRNNNALAASAGGRQGGRSVSLRSKRQNKRRFPCMCRRCCSHPPPNSCNPLVYLPPLAPPPSIAHNSTALANFALWVDFLSTASTSSFRFRKFAFAALVIYSSFWKPSFCTSFEEHKARSRKIHSREKIRREKRQQEWVKKGRQRTRASVFFFRFWCNGV